MTIEQQPAGRDRAAICYTCPHARKGRTGRRRGEPVWCARKRRRLRDVLSDECDRWPDAEGVVRWLGVRWYGLPYPLRLRLWWRHPRHPRPGSWVLCGCSVRMKAAWLAVSGAVRRVFPAEPARRPQSPPEPFGSEPTRGPTRPPSVAHGKS